MRENASSSSFMHPNCSSHLQREGMRNRSCSVVGIPSLVRMRILLFLLALCTVGGPPRLRLRIKIAPFNDRLPLCDLLIWAASLSNYGGHAVLEPNLSHQQNRPKIIHVPGKAKDKSQVCMKTIAQNVCTSRARGRCSGAINISPGGFHATFICFGGSCSQVTFVSGPACTEFTRM